MKILVIDTCGDAGSVALGDGTTVMGLENLPPRGASVELLPAIERLLTAAGWLLCDLGGVGVVSGPGSFTGVRVGLAAAKGLCEAAGLRLVGVSRLEILATSARLVNGIAVLDAGRGEFYVRAGAREMLCTKDDLAAVVGDGRVVVAEEKLVASLEMFHVEQISVGAAGVLPLVLRDLAANNGDAAFVDANYVRAESDIYARSGAKA